MVTTPFGKYQPIVSLDRAFFKTLSRSAQDIQGRLTKWQGGMDRANKEALKFLQDEAADVLAQRIQQTGRPQDHNTGRLMRAIKDPGNHEANKYRINFMIDAKVRPTVPYYGAIEFGSDYWVRTGRRLPFAFFGGPFDAKTGNFGRSRNSGGYMVGPREYRRRSLDAPTRLVQIKRPVPAYLYGTTALERLMSGPYDEIVLRHLGPETDELGGTLRSVPSPRTPMGGARSGGRARAR